MKVIWYSAVLIISLVFLLVGCTQGIAPTLLDETIPSSEATLSVDEMLSGAGTVLPTKESDMSAAQIPQPTNLPSGFEDLIAKAKDDLARRVSISKMEINLVEATAVVWPDSSMGCPQPGMAYLQVPEDGALIILEANGQLYEYHNGGNRGLFLCEMLFKDPNKPSKMNIPNLIPPTPDNSIPPGGDQ